ncbi:MAG: DUF2993 domain-containing protein [Spirulinaceae cyanobacterium]
MLQNYNLGEQALNKIAELALASQFTQSEHLAVRVVTEPTLLAQGKLASLSIQGSGLVLRSGLQMAQMKLKMGEITVNPLRALMGKIELLEPIQGTGKIVLTEANFTRALLTEPFRRRLRTLPDLEVDRLEGQWVTPQQVALKLRYWTPLGGQQTAVLQADVSPQAPIALTNPRYLQGSEPSPACTDLLLQQAAATLNLQRFELNGMTLQVQGVAIADHQAQIQTHAQMTEFPA